MRFLGKKLSEHKAHSKCDDYGSQGDFFFDHQSRKLLTTTTPLLD